MKAVRSFGRLQLEVEGHDPVADFWHTEFAALDHASGSRPHLRLRTGTLTPLAGFVRRDPFLVGRDRYRIRTDAFVADISRDADGIADVVVEPRPARHSRLWPRTAQRVRDWSYLTQEERTAKKVLDEVFDPLSQIVQLPLGQTLLHGSTIVRDGGAVTLLAWGGTGKTSSVLRLVAGHGWQYLSDDLTLLDVDGTVRPHPKKLQVSDHDLRGDSELRALLLSERSLLDRAAWQLHLRLKDHKRVRRRVRAEELFGPARVAGPSRLTRALWLERADTPSLTQRSLSSRELARRASWTILQELSVVSAPSAALHSTGFPSTLPTLQDLYEQTFELLERTLDPIPTSVVQIPPDTSPDALASYLSNHALGG